MNIIYSAGNRIGANNQLLRFLENTNHNIKIAAYISSSYSIPHVDWILNAVHINNYPFVEDLESIRNNQNVVELLLNDVFKFKPNLIISDSEHILVYIAKRLEIPVWYCSPLNLIEAINWKKPLIYDYLFNQYKNKLPKADKYLIYSSFCDILNPPEIKENYTWIRPYYTEPTKVCIDENSRRIIFNNILRYIDLNDYSFTDGNTNSISNLFYHNKKIIISPNAKNLEALVNSVLIEQYKIGHNVGQIELMGNRAVDALEDFTYKECKNIELNNSNHLQLHEYIEEHAYSF